MLQISRCKIFVAIGNKQFRPEKKEAVDRHIVVTCCYLLSLVVTCCYLLLLLIVTCCHMLLLVVTYCQPLLLMVTCCYLLLLLVICCSLFVGVCCCFYPLPSPYLRSRAGSAMRSSRRSLATLGLQLCLAAQSVYTEQEKHRPGLCFFFGICLPWLHL